MLNGVSRHVECTSGRTPFLVFRQRGSGHVEWGISTCRGGPGLTPFTLFLHTFVNSKGKMVISHLAKYSKILYQKIALRVWIPTQQTVHDFEFSSPSYARFTKMCLAGRGALDMSSGASRHVECPSGRTSISCFWAEGKWTCRVGHLDMSRGSWADHFHPLFAYKTHINKF